MCLSPRIAFTGETNDDIYLACHQGGLRFRISPKKDSQEIKAIVISNNSYQPNFLHAANRYGAKVLNKRVGDLDRWASRFIRVGSAGNDATFSKDSRASGHESIATGWPGRLWQVPRVAAQRLQRPSQCETYLPGFVD